MLLLLRYLEQNQLWIWTGTVFQCSSWLSSLSILPLSVLWFLRLCFYPPSKFLIPCSLKTISLLMFKMTISCGAKHIITLRYELSIPSLLPLIVKPSKPKISLAITKAIYWVKYLFFWWWLFFFIRLIPKNTNSRICRIMNHFISFSADTF